MYKWIVRFLAGVICLGFFMQVGTDSARAQGFTLTIEKVCDPHTTESSELRLETGAGAGVLSIVLNCGDSATPVGVPSGQYRWIETSLPAGYSATNISCTAPGAVADIANRSITFDVTNADVTCTFTNRRAQEQTRERIRNSLQRRADRITVHDPLLTPHLNGSGLQSNTGPVNVTAVGGQASTRMAFSTSLRQMAEASARQKSGHAGAMALGYSKGSGPAAPPDPGFNIWAQGVIEHFDDDAGPLDDDGTFGLLYLGGEYRVRPGLLLGILAQYDRMDEDNDLTGGEIEGNGWMVGPYVVGKISRQIYFQARAAWGESDNDINPFGSYTDSFDTERWLVSGKIEGRYQRGSWRISPIGSIIYFEEDQEGYIDTPGNVIAAQTVSLGRLMFGPQIAHGRDLGDGRYLEWFGEVQGIWDFDSDDRFAGGIAVGTDDARAKVSGGVKLLSSGGTRLEAAGFVDGLGADDFDAYGGTLKVRIPLN